MISSNSGSKLVGTSTELTRAFQEMDHIKIDNILKENGGEWMMWKQKPTQNQETWEEFWNARFRVQEEF